MFIVVAPVLIFSGIYIAIGCYFLFSYFCIPSIRSNHTLWFVAACFLSAFYNFTRIGMYTASTIESFHVWIWCSHTMIPVLAISIAGFLNHYARDDKKKFTNFFYLGFGLLALSNMLGGSFTFKVKDSYHGALGFFETAIPRYQCDLGIIAVSLYVFLLASVCYCLFNFFVWGAQGDKKEVRALFFGVTALFITVVFDIYLSFNFILFVFLGEYGFFFLILCMCYSTVRQIASLRQTKGPMTGLKSNKNPGDELLKGLDTESLKSQLLTLMHDHKVFKDGNISLETMANQLSLSSQKFSRFLNLVMDCDFRNFMNRFRIEEAKRLLSEKPDLSIKFICYEVGFQSKSTFHDAFKRFTGTTPSAFRKNPQELDG